MPELYRFLRDKGGWEPQSTVVRKGGGFLTPLSRYSALAFPYLSKVLHHLKTQLSFKTPDDMCLETRRSVKEANNGRAWVVEPKGFNKDLNDLFRFKNTCQS